MAVSAEKTTQNSWLYLLLSLLGVMLLCLALGLGWLLQNPSPGLAFQQPTDTPAPTFTPIPTFTITLLPPTVTHTPAPPTPTSTRVVVAREVDQAATASVKQTATARAAATLANMAPLAQSVANTSLVNQSASHFKQNTRLVLAHYFAWFDGNGWDNCNISAGDKPLQPYHSDDTAAIARHVQMAQEIGLNGFTLHWFAPGDRTDRNFNTLLHQSEGTSFASTVVFSHHIWHGQPHDIPGALQYIVRQYGPHPNFLRVGNKPVIFFTDVYRTPGGQPAQQYWATVRNQVDPQRQTIWIAEGLDPAYLDTFDGLYVFKISHANYPHDYQKSDRWGARVREWSKQTQQTKLWIATITPGWDDLRSGCQPDVRVDNTEHRLDRTNGATYEATFNAAIASKPNWLIVGSFNEWVEGTYIEPSVQYGDKYMQMTKEFVQRFRGR